MRKPLDLRSNRDIRRIVVWQLARWFLPTSLCSRDLLDEQRRPYWWMDAVNPTPPPQSYPFVVGRTRREITCPCRRCTARKAA